MTRPFFLKLVIPLLAITLLAAACGDDDDTSSAESTEDATEETAPAIYDGECVEATGTSVTVYSGRTENLMEPVFEAFECETGIDYEVRWGDADELALLLQEEGDRTSADVYLSNSPGPIGFLESEGLIATLDDSVLDLVEEQNRSSQGTWVGFTGRKRVLVYNVDNVSDDELPASVFELTDAIYNDRVAIPADNGSFKDWFTVFRDQYGNDVAAEWLDDMVANGAEPYANNRAIVEAVGRGEIDMGLVNHYYNYQEAAAIGDDHRALNHDFDPDDIGSLLIITAATVTTASEKATEGTALVSYLLSDGAQRYFTEETFEYPLADGVEPAAILPPLDALEIGTVDYDSLSGGLEETNAIIEASGILNE